MLQCVALLLSYLSVNDRLQTAPLSGAPENKFFKYILDAYYVYIYTLDVPCAMIDKDVVLENNRLQTAFLKRPKHTVLLVQIRHILDRFICVLHVPRPRHF